MPNLGLVEEDDLDSPDSFATWVATMASTLNRSLPTASVGS